MNLWDKVGYMLPSVMMGIFIGVIADEKAAQRRVEAAEIITRGTQQLAQRQVNEMAREMNNLLQENAEKLTQRYDVIIRRTTQIIGEQQRECLVWKRDILREDYRKK